MKHLLTIFFFLFSLFGGAQVGFDFDEVQKLPDAINSPYEESSPVYDEANERLYFTRALHPDNKGGQDLGQDLWYVDLNGDTWGQPSNDLGPLNNYLNNAAIGVSDAGDELYLMSTYIKKVSLQTGFSRAVQDGGKWKRPEALNLSVTTRSPYYGGFVNPELNVMIISMESFSSKGEEDLYVSIRTEKGWSKPIWLGDSVNSAGYEISPFLFDDGITLMFASNGMGGQGDCDIFYAYRKDSTWTNWTKPVNAGDLVNSPGFDAFPFAAGDKVMFSSNRNDSLSNIYQATNIGVYKDADPVRVVFDWMKSRLPNVAVDVLDMRNDTIGRFYADYNNVVTIDGLKAGREYKLLPSHQRAEVRHFEPFVLSLRDDYIESLSYESDGSILLNAKDPQETRYADAIDVTLREVGMRGLFEVDKVPMKNQLLALRDAEGNVLQYAVTRNDGSFIFAETEDTLGLGIEVMTNLDYIKKKAAIYYTDENGNKLIKLKSQDGGLFRYERLSEAEVAQLRMIQEQDAAMDQKLVKSKGIFSYESLPQAGVTLSLYDENNKLLETAVTDSAGQFEFTKLRPDKNFSIRPEGETVGEGSLTFVDKNGNVINALMSRGFGFEYEALRTEVVEGLMLLEEEDNSAQKFQSVQQFIFTVGLFNYQDLPKDGVTLRLLDENDNVVETVVTSAGGQFTFSALEADKAYRIQILGMDSSELNESELYIVDKNGKVTTALLDPDKYYAFSKLDPDNFFTLKQINEGESGTVISSSFRDVFGVFKYEELAKAGVQIELYDEHDKLIETVITDEEGVFRFSKLANESKFYAKLSAEDQEMLDGAFIELRNDSNELLRKIHVWKDGFSFETIVRDENQLVAAEADDTELKLDALQPKKKQTTAMGDLPNELVMRSIYFNFNSVRLSNNDRYKLNHDVFLKAYDSGQPILIVGYTCDLGDSEKAEETALLRAEMVKRYLVNLGMDPDRIEVDGIAPNSDQVMSGKERIESRRVDVYHLAP